MIQINNWKSKINTLNEVVYVSEQPWLEFYDGKPAQFTIEKDIDGRWISGWWHGNQGHTIQAASSLEDAQFYCSEHLSKMLAGLIKTNI